MVTSLLAMQKRTIMRAYHQNGEVPFEYYIQNVEDITNRIRSIAIIHDMISKKDENNESVAHLREIVQKISEFYSHATVRYVAREEFDIAYNISTSIALVINELINNSVKHGSQRNRTEIMIQAARTSDENILIEVSDNGEGFKVQQTDRSGGTGIGMRLIEGIVSDELNGSLTRHER